MARNKLEGPELKLYEIDTMQYLTRKNIAYGVTALVEFGRKGCLPIANNIGLSVGKAMERFKDAFNPADIINGNASGSAYDTWLRKNGLLDSQDGKYQLSELGYALSSSMITDREYCFLLLSKQWIKITDVGSQVEYKKNLLAFLFDTLKNGEPISESSFVSTIGQQSLNLYDANYQDLKISNGEAARFLVDPLKIAEIIDVKDGNIVLHEKVTSLVDDYLKNEEKIKSPSQVGCVEERFWNSFDYGVYDLISDDNRNLYSSVYPNLFRKRSSFSMNSTKQKIFFGAPGTGKSHKIDNGLFKNDDGSTCGLKSVPQDCKFRTTFHPDYDYAQFVGAYKPKSICDTTSLEILDPGNLSIEDLTDIAKKMYNDGIPHPYARLGTLYYKSLNAVSASTSGAKKDICDKSSNGKDNGPELNTGIFIGEYIEKEISLKENKITYSFVPQVFAKAYVAAWKNYLADQENPKPVYLVIEEINRGNCAQIFGDIFQLLDRKDGHSEYPIDVDSDFATYIRETLGDKFATYKKMICSYCEDAAAENATTDEKFCKIALPPNFNILATMNTSDQSLFPMDSAFKRRFDWEYVPIDYKQENANFFIEIGDMKYSWLDFLKAVNKDIAKATLSEDKQMGEFFVKPKNNVIDLDMFRSKVLFYLWDSVYKEETSQNTIFHFPKGNDPQDKVTFQTLFEGEVADQEKLAQTIFENLNVEALTNGDANADPENGDTVVEAVPDDPENPEA